MENKELYHFGIKGMRWGVRRTPEQLGRRSTSSKEDNRSSEEIKKKMDKLFTQSIKTGKDKSPISPAEKIAKESEKTISEATNLANSISHIRQRRKNDTITNMTNAELQKAIDRMRLEEQYSTLSASRVSKGASYTKDILGIAGSVVGIGASALGIATAIKSLKG